MAISDDRSAAAGACFQHLGHLLELDDGPGRYRIGLLALANDYVVERDFMNLRPSDEVMVFTSRIPFEGDCTVENLSAMAPHLTAATSLLLPGGRLDAVVYGCTSGTALIGYEGVRAAVQAARPDVPCVTPVTAAQAAFRHLGIERIAVLAPYTDAVTRPLVANLGDAGLEVVKVSNFDIENSDDISAVVPSAIREGAGAADSSEADALFISCTDFRAVEVLAEIEAKLGKPVVASNQAMFWQALRQAGYMRPVPGYGRLLEL